jgi:Zn-finger nucleic acid-binding protein/ribosomal protein S27AE
MTDAYRTSGFMCPTCPNSALREFQDRLVCDECNGMLIADDDVVASVQELDGSDDALEVHDATPAKAACPRCRGAMSTCGLKIGSLALTGTFLRCASDGIWFPRDAMTAMFARVSRRGGFRGFGAGSSNAGGVRGPASSGGAMVSNMPSGHGGMSGAMAGIANAFGGGSPASSGLAISHWGNNRPRVHTLFVSAHKDRQLGCPSCTNTKLAYQGDRWACTACAGSFVENAGLAAMVEEMALRPWTLPPVSGAPGERACPICATAMIVELLEAVTIDRCAEHGVWFDDTELQAALHHASAEPTGLAGWVKHLFHRPK